MARGKPLPGMMDRPRGERPRSWLRQVQRCRQSLVGPRAPPAVLRGFDQEWFFHSLVVQGAPESTSHKAASRVYSLPACRGADVSTLPYAAWPIAGIALHSSLYDARGHGL